MTGVGGVQQRAMSLLSFYRRPDRGSGKERFSAAQDCQAQEQQGWYELLQCVRYLYLHGTYIQTVQPPGRPGGGSGGPKADSSMSEAPGTPQFKRDACVLADLRWKREDAAILQHRCWWGPLRSPMLPRKTIKHCRCRAPQEGRPAATAELSIHATAI